MSRNKGLPWGAFLKWPLIPGKAASQRGFPTAEMRSLPTKEPAAPFVRDVCEFRSINTRVRGHKNPADFVLSDASAGLFPTVKRLQVSWLRRKRPRTLSSARLREYGSCRPAAAVLGRSLLAGQPGRGYPRAAPPAPRLSPPHSGTLAGTKEVLHKGSLYETLSAP
jgi:hypothetical protein